MTCGHCEHEIFTPDPIYWVSSYPDGNFMLYPYCNAQCSLADYEERRQYAKPELPDIHTLNNMVNDLLEKHDGNAQKK